MLLLTVVLSPKGLDSEVQTSDKQEYPPRNSRPRSGSGGSLHGVRTSGRGRGIQEKNDLADKVQEPDPMSRSINQSINQPTTQSV